jgi:hypothetical protein
MRDTILEFLDSTYSDPPELVVDMKLGLKSFGNFDAKVDKR